MIVAEVVRSGFVESVHHGAVAILGGDSRGDVTRPIFPRSSNKPLQTVGMLRAGLVPREPADLALISGSHFGEPFHVERVRAMLAAAGLDESALRCAVGLPLREEARDAWLRSGGGPERVLMNCSGKHAGMLATCVANDWPLDSYLDPKHPLQVAIAETVTDLVGEPIAAVGVDGCGAPVLGFSLTALARSFQRLVDAVPGSPERLVADQMRARPELVAGTGADDTVLMGAVPGLLVKVGAEGVVAAALPGAGAIAVKIDDGAARARTPVLLDALRELGVEPPLIPADVIGGDEVVGEVRPVR